MSCNCFIKTSCSISPLVLPEDARQSLDVSQREGRSTFVPAQDVCLLTGKPGRLAAAAAGMAAGAAALAICGGKTNTGGGVCHDNKFTIT